MQQNGKKCNVMNTICMRNNQARKTTAEALNGIKIQGSFQLKHRPEILEDSVITILKDDLSKEYAGNVLCVDCTRFCKHEPGLHLYVEWNIDPDMNLMHDASILIRSALQRAHSTLIPEIIFFKENTFGSDIIPKRFTIRDLLLQKTLGENIIYISTDYTSPEDIENCHEDNSQLCCTCFEDFSKFINCPLDIQHFDIIREWINNVPLPVQIFLENCFLNKQSFQKSSAELIDFHRSKLASLYCQLDSLLNVLNKKYSGITQDMNTDELLVNYHNVTTVFAITSQAGISQSLRTGDRRLKQHSDLEACYHKTYLQQYPMLYKRPGDIEDHLYDVNIGDCYLILMMDNLVHLTMKTDPKPGECKTNQICTLPITIKGIPKDCIEAYNWHDTNCDRDPNCTCKIRKQLTKDDVQKTLIEPSPEESVCNEIFKTECIWGEQSLWKTIFSVLSQATSCESINITNIDNRDSTHQKPDCSTPVYKYTMDSSTADNILKQDTKDPEPLDKSMEALSLDFAGGEDDLAAHLDVVNETLESLHLEGDLDRTIEEVDGSVQGISDISDIEREMSDHDISSSSETELDNISDDEEPGSRHVQEDQNIFLDLIGTEEEREIQDLVNAISVLSDTAAFPPPSNNTGEDYTSPCFTTSTPPPMLCRHPPPASGRDDDILVLKNVLDDVLLKTKLLPSSERILFAPDYKIASNLFKLKDSRKKYDEAFLAEFPVLHLRKSKITNLVSAYTSSGLIYMLQFMKNQDADKDWDKLLTIENIETATRNIWRLSAALHISFVLKFLSTLLPQEAQQLQDDLCSQLPSELNKQWRSKFDEFMTSGKSQNPTFCLHAEMMAHCDEIVAIAVAERISGPDGYHLLLANVKSSLPFSYLNGASSYAKFCTRLLYEHYSAGLFHKNMKKALFSTSHNGSSVNFGLDTAREIDHRTAKKCIRPGVSKASLLSKMCTVDEQQQIHKLRKSLLSGEEQSEIEDKEEANDINIVNESAAKYMGKQVTSNDQVHIIRIIKLIQRRDALQLTTDAKPRNVYHSKKPEISENLLDTHTYDIGKFLILKHAAEEKLFGMQLEDIPCVDDVKGPKALLGRVKRTKSTTISRSRCSKMVITKTKVEKEEQARETKVKKESKILDCFSSRMNTCQAVLKPDCSKSSTTKSMGMKRALTTLLKTCLSDNENIPQDSTEENATSAGTQLDNPDTKLRIDDLVLIGFDNIPKEISLSTTKAVVEFAGVKFKTFSTSGRDYIQSVSTNVIHPLLRQLPSLNHVILCEEKYSFTPDDFKAATRSKREKKEKVTISHLKKEEEILSSDTFNKPAIVSTMEGKQLISKYLGSYADKLEINSNLILDIDSEAVVSKCDCQNVQKCDCTQYAVPIRLHFTEQGLSKKECLKNIKQRKGEAEMSQVDWMRELPCELSNGEIVVNYVTSADIDTLVIHLFCISIYWPRDSQNNFKWPVFLWLQKKKPELYNITEIIITLEKHFKIPNIAAIVAIVLAMGGNDFLLNFHGISHDKVLTMVTTHPNILANIVTFTYDEETKALLSCQLDYQVYLDLIKHLYCPGTLDASKLTIEEVRQISIKLPNKDIFRHPQQWMPPTSALQYIAKLIQGQIDYLLTAWNHEAALPNFLDMGPLKIIDGIIMYHLGNDIHVDDRKDLIIIDEGSLAEKITNAQEVKKKQRKSKKRLHTEVETPRKPETTKRIPRMSTPSKIKTRRCLKKNYENND